MKKPSLKKQSSVLKWLWTNKLQADLRRVCPMKRLALRKTLCSKKQLSPRKQPCLDDSGQPEPQMYRHMNINNQGFS